MANFSSQLRQTLTRALGPTWSTRLRCMVKGRGLPQWGNLRRLQPFSDTYGWDRGTPVDRYYVDRFFARHRQQITGDVLEIDRNIYTQRYGHHLDTVHSIDISPQSEPTFLCDIAHCEQVVPSESYDCVLLPCTLQHFRELELCLRQVLRMLKPGGVILATASGLSRLDHPQPDFWRFTPEGWRELLGRVWVDCTVVVEGEGNPLAVMAMTLGLAFEELSCEELDHNDVRYPLVTTIYCRKPGSGLTDGAVSKQDC